MTKKRIWITVVTVLVIAGIIGGVIWANRSDSQQPQDDTVLVTQVSEIMGLSSSQQGLQSRFAGVVEPQKTLEIQLQEGMTVAEVLVEEGQTVKEGDPLFRYDTAETTMNLEQQKLELEKLNNTIESQRQKIAELEKEKQNASEDMQLQYTMEIQESTASLKQTEYDAKVKSMEIEKTQASIDQAIVTSTMAGVVQSIQSSTEQMGGENASQQSFITILAQGEYRVKGTINEQNMYQISTDMPVLIRSRVQEDQVWTGHISEIDTQSPVQNQSGYGNGNTDAMQQSSDYPFYVTLDSYDGLMLGQHVYIEIGQTSTPHTEGVWLYEGYLISEEDGSYSVWVDAQGQLEKRTVTLGEYDEALGQYEITEGLEQSDRIAWPEERLQEGVSVMVE